MTAEPGTDPDFVDYYETLGIPPDAGSDTIRERLDALILEWQQFTGSGKKELRRRAEDTLERVAEAERVLLDPQRRAAYDEQRARQAAEAAAERAPGTPPERPASSGGTPGEQNLAHARAALSDGDHQGARYFSTRATEENPDLADAWFILFAACMGTGDLYRAEVAGTTAVRLKPNDSWTLSAVGRALAGPMGRPERGFALMEKAAELEGTVESGLGLARFQRALGHNAHALETTRRLHERFPDVDEVRDELAQTLIGRAQGVPRVRGRASYSITSSREMARMEELAREARAVRPVSEEAHAALKGLEQNLSAARKTVFTPRLFRSRMSSVTVWSMAAAGAFLGLFLPGPLGLLVFLVVAVVPLHLVVTRCHPKRWELNARITPTT